MSDKVSKKRRFNNHVMKKLHGNGDKSTLRVNKYEYEPARKNHTVLTEDEREFAVGMNFVRTGKVKEWPKPNETSAFHNGVFHAMMMRSAENKKREEQEQNG